MLPFKGRNRVTSIFGTRTLNGVTTTHKGIDLVGDDDRTVYAVSGGTVLQSRIVTDKSNKTWEWGNYVSVRTSAGNVEYYCHMDSRAVKAGDSITPGQKIGVMGNTGYSFGAHLHFEVRNSAGVSINPASTLGILNATGTYSNSGTDNTVQEGEDMTLRSYAIDDFMAARTSIMVESPSQYGMTLGVDGQRKMLKPVYSAKEITKDNISAAMDKCEQDGYLTPDHVVFLTED